MKGLKQNDKKKISRNEGKEDVCEFRQKRQRGLRLSAVTGVSKGLSDFEFPLFFLSV